MDGGDGRSLKYFTLEFLPFPPYPSIAMRKFPNSQIRDQTYCEKLGSGHLMHTRNSHFSMLDNICSVDIHSSATATCHKRPSHIFIQGCGSYSFGLIGQFVGTTTCSHVCVFVWNGTGGMWPWACFKADLRNVTNKRNAALCSVWPSVFSSEKIKAVGFYESIRFWPWFLRIGIGGFHYEMALIC